MTIDVYKDWLGIPDGPRPPDHYQLLRCVQFEDDPEKIRKHYKKLNVHVRKYASGQYSVQSQDLLNELAKAMLCLTDVDRKLEYDKSLGREIDDRDPNTGRKPLLAVLQGEDFISAEQAREVKSYAERTGLSHRDAIVQMKLAPADMATRALATELGRPYVELGDLLPDDSVLDKIPRAVVRRHTCLPLFEDDGEILVACADEPTQELEDEVRLRCGKPMRTVLSLPLGINQGIAKYYAAGLRTEAPEPVRKGGFASSSSKSAPSKAAKAVAKAATDPAEQRNIGLLLIMATVIVLTNLDSWVLWGVAWRYFMPGWFPFVSTICLGGPIIFGLYNKYLK